MKFRSSIRTRLTLWYVSLLAVVLLLFSAGSSMFFFVHLREQMDDRLAQDIESLETHLQKGADGHVGLVAIGGEENDAAPDWLLEVWSSNGALLYQSPELHSQRIGKRPTRGGASRANGSVRLDGGARVRFLDRSHGIDGELVTVRLAISEEPVWREFSEMLTALGIGLPVALLLVGGTGYAVARRALRPLDSMARRAEQITAERLSERLTVANPDDELGHLARVFNETLARLERSFEQLRRFTADASHELRTPLTAIRSVGEVALQGAGSTEHYRDVVGSMLEEVNRLAHLVDSLLTLSRADAGRMQPQFANVQLLDLAKESFALLEVLAEEKNQHVLVDGDSHVAVQGDPLILRQALVNLIDNAIKYSPTGGKVSVLVAREGSEALVEVRDSGPGIPPEHRSKVFERFYRIDEARTREEGGSGLGLSIAEWAVGVHGGRIELQCNGEPGCRFRIRLPMT